MKDLNKIDELLKEQMQDFTPDVPAEVWTQISSNLSVGPAPVNPVSELTFGIKAAIVSGIAVVAGASYFLLGGADPQPKQETSMVLPSIESAKEEIVQDHKSTEVTSEKFEKPSVQFNSQKPSTKTEEKQLESNGIIHPEDAKENTKVENFVPQEVHTTKTESLISVDTKTEIVEGNPEQEHKDEIIPEEHKSNELETKKDYPVVNNAFSPNGDGMNDELVIEMPAVDYYHLRIFTKKGVLVFETDNVQTKWKGQVLGSGLAADNGEYRYIIEYQPKGKETVKAIGGYIYLNR